MPGEGINTLVQVTRASVQDPSVTNRLQFQSHTQVWTLQVCLGKKSRCLLIYLYIFEFMWKYNCLVNAQVFLCTIFWSYIVIGLLLLDIIRPSRKIWYWQKSPKHHPSQSWWHAYGECFPTRTFYHLLTIIMTCLGGSWAYVCLIRHTFSSFEASDPKQLVEVF